MAQVWQGAAAVETPRSDNEIDRDIVTRARLDPRAFAPLYDRYLDPIYRYCYRRLGTREADPDLLAVARTWNIARPGAAPDQ